MSAKMHKSQNPHRNTIYVEDAEILINASYPGGQYVLRLRSPKCAAYAQPGQFVHLQCHPGLLMRRPFSIMRASKAQGWIDIFYKLLGEGSRLLSYHKQGDTLSLMGPIGVPFTLHSERPRTLLLGGGVGMPPIVFLAERLRLDRDFMPLVMLGSEIPFPFAAQPSRIIVPGIPDGVIAAMPLMEDWGIASRLASRQDFPGCFDGLITELSRLWLDRLSIAEREEVEVFACGPPAMLKEVAELARYYHLPCQVSLEEYMACAVGGCAGCAVKVRTEQGPTMKRVCVDGPVFDAEAVFSCRNLASGGVTHSNGGDVA
jgi:dihydroorotate dehydrogenase electron transfer subunit